MELRIFCTEDRSRKPLTGSGLDIVPGMFGLSSALRNSISGIRWKPASNDNSSDAPVKTQTESVAPGAAWQGVGYIRRFCGALDNDAAMVSGGEGPKCGLRLLRIWLPDIVQRRKNDEGQRAGIPAGPLTLRGWQNRRARPKLRPARTPPPMRPRPG